MFRLAALSAVERPTSFNAYFRKLLDYGKEIILRLSDGIVAVSWTTWSVLGCWAWQGWECEGARAPVKPGATKEVTQHQVGRLEI
jgi:hypothetical protein